MEEEETSTEGWEENRIAELNGLLIRMKKFCSISPMSNLTLNEITSLITLYQGGLEKGAALTMSEAGQLLDLCRSAMSQLVSRLERKGMLKRELVLWDRRKTTVKLTEKGKKLVKQLNDERLRAIKNAIKILGKEQIDIFISLFETYMDAMEGDNYA